MKTTSITPNTPATPKRLVAACLICFAVNGASAAEVVTDDFEDRDPRDGNPVSWGMVGGTAEFHADDGDLAMRRTGKGTYGFAVTTYTHQLENTSVRAQLRLSLDNTPNVFLWAQVSGLRWVVGALRPGGDMYVSYKNNDTEIESPRVSTDFRVAEEDVVLQLDIIGQELSLYAWLPGEPMPKEPQVTLIVPTTQAGGLGVGLRGDFDPTLTIRYITFSCEPIRDVPPLKLTGVERQDENTLEVGWTGGEPPYQLEASPSLEFGTWQAVGPATYHAGAVVPIIDPNRFFRVASRSGLPLEEFFLDDFDSARESPVRWEKGLPHDGFEGRFQDYTPVETPEGWRWTPNSTENMGGWVDGLSYADVSLRTQVRLLGPNASQSSYLYLMGRGSYWAGIHPSGELTIWHWDDSFLQSIQTSLDVVNNDIHLQFDMLGDTLSLTAWRDGQRKPESAQISLRHSRETEGPVGLFYNTGPTLSTSLFRYFQLERLQGEPR